MGYLFYNNFPYDYSIFPTMQDHVDPVCHDYFSGLHNEIQNIEYCLGLLPSGEYGNVSERFDKILDNKYAIIPMGTNKWSKSNTSPEPLDYPHSPGIAWSVISEKYNVYARCALSAWCTTTHHIDFVLVAVPISDLDGHNLSVNEYPETGETFHYTDWVLVNDIGH